MKVKVCRMWVILGMTVTLFLKASQQMDYQTENVKLNIETVIALSGEICGSVFEEETKAEMPDIELEDTETKDLSLYYGNYRIKEYFPWWGIQRQNFNERRQEAEMMLGRVIEIKQNRLFTYDMGDRDFTNFIIRRFVKVNPEYEWQSFYSDVEVLADTDIIARNIETFGKDWSVEQLEGVITVVLQKERWEGCQSFYFMKDTDEVILFSNMMSGGAFLLERCEEETAEVLAGVGDQEKRELLQRTFGEYQVTEFIPTKYYAESISEYGRIAILPEEEKKLMMGKKIVISQNYFITYDNYREPSSYNANRVEDGFWLDKVTIEQPDYQVKRMWANEIYGIRDGILTGDLMKEEYVEIDVYPGYETNKEWNLSQMYLIDEKRIVMYAMGQYFLLMRVDSLEDGNNVTEVKNPPDLSEWIGRYKFSEENVNLKSKRWFKKDYDVEFESIEVTREYEIDIIKDDLGEFYADIMIYEKETDTKAVIRADVCGDNEIISFIFKKFLSVEEDEETGWFSSYSDILFSFKKCDDTDEILTYWGAVHEYCEPGVYFEEE